MRNKLIEIAKQKIPNNDPSHDIYHALRVLKNCEYIASVEGGDLEILIPAALFHDVICYPKQDEKSKMSVVDSAKMAEEILNGMIEYPKGKIKQVSLAIKECSFSKKIIPSSKESEILQDADRLESTGVISIMRTFSSAGQMGHAFYAYEDPFCENREPEAMKYAVDLFHSRLLKVESMMNTATAKGLARKKTERLNRFLDELKAELEDAN